MLPLYNSTMWNPSELLATTMKYLEEHGIEPSWRAHSSHVVLLANYFAIILSQERNYDSQQRCITATSHEGGIVNYK